MTGPLQDVAAFSLTRPKCLSLIIGKLTNTVKPGYKYIRPVKGPIKYDLFKQAAFLKR